MNDFAVKVVQFTNYSPFFKGPALIILGLLALLFAFYMKRKWKEPASIGYWIFLGLAVFIILFGIYILVFEPQWWRLPY